MRVLFAALLLLAGGSSGCLVQSRCQSNADCPGDESCDRPQGQLLGDCHLECSSDLDCWEKRTPGMVCDNHRCGFPSAGGERVQAPKFCLKVVNPKSSYYGKELCLADLQGKVVMIFFAQLF